MRVLHLQVRSGLCNRLRALLSAMEGTPTTENWPANPLSAVAVRLHPRRTPEQHREHCRLLQKRTAYASARLQAGLTWEQALLS